MSVANNKRTETANLIRFIKKKCNSGPDLITPSEFPASGLSDDIYGVDSSGCHLTAQ